MAGRKLIIEVVGDASKLDRSLKQAKSSLRGFSKDVTKSAPGGKLGGLALGGIGKAGVIGAGVAAGAAVASKAIGTVIAAAKDAEIAQANLDQAFKSSGVSQAKYGKSVEASIQSVSKLAAIDDEVVSGSFANLLRSTKSVEKATKGTALAANIARARNISLAAATKMVEKAYLGSDTAFKRVGVSVPKSTKNYDALKARINKVNEAYKAAKGPQKEALKVQLGALKAGILYAKGLDKQQTALQAIAVAQKQFAGGAAAYGKTAAGAQEKYKVALENVEERIGAKLLPLQTKLALAAVRFLNWADKNWPRFAKAIGDAYRMAKPYIDNLIARIRDVVKVFQGVIEVIKGIRNGDWSLVWKGIKKAAIGEINLIYHSFVQLPLRIAKALGSAAWNAVTAAIKAAINKAIDVINRAIRAINKAIPNRLHMDIPLIPKLGDSGGTTKSASYGSPKGLAGPTRALAMAGGGAIVFEHTTMLDGKVIERSTTRHQQKNLRRNPKQTRGASR